MQAHVDNVHVYNFT